MKFEEILLKTTVKTDDKARRRTNVSKKVANITVEEIENGVSIEKLTSLNVPVFRYGGQVTIHGVLPDINETRINGYQSIIKNGNGTIGVKYLAIDGVKKALIQRANYASKDSTMGVCVSSTGMSFQKRFFDKTECIEFLQSVPDLYIGSKYIGTYMGMFYTVVEFMSIEEKNLWEMIDWLTGIKSMDELVAIEKVKQDKYDSERKEREAIREVELQKIKVKSDLVTSICEKNLVKAPQDFQKVAGTYCKVSGLGKLSTYTLSKDSGRMKYSNGLTFNELKSSSTMKQVFKRISSKGQWYLINEQKMEAIKSIFQSEFQQVAV
jgi:hypothetical protein